MRTIYRTNVPELKVVNTDTGEIISGVAKISYNTIDEFIMCFLSSIGKISTLDGNTIKVLMWCWKLSSYNVALPTGNIIHNNRAFKESIREQGGNLTDSCIDKAIHILAKERFLIRRCKGDYFLNPEYFFKGTLTNRSKLKCEISYNQ